MIDAQAVAAWAHSTQETLVMSDQRPTRRKTHMVAERPPFERIALILQGGGALGSYQAGVYQALAEANLHPDWVAGISIGAANSALSPAIRRGSASRNCENSGKRSLAPPSEYLISGGSNSKASSPIACSIKCIHSVHFCAARRASSSRVCRRLTSIRTVRSKLSAISMSDR